MALVSLADVFGDLVIYRDLNPVDPRLPRYADIWHEIGMTGPIPPRKLDMAYARALARLLTHAQAAARPKAAPLSEIIYLGDTMLNDGGAFQNLRTLTGWPGWCFIGAEKDETLRMAEREDAPGLYQANRWIAVAGFLAQAQAEGAALDASTAVIVDIDKTALGARGRNDKSIDHARVAAIEATLRDAIGPAFNEAEFRQAYAVINAPQYHPFTADNQDNVAYICLMVSAHMIELDDLLARAADGRLKGFRDLMAQIEAQCDRLPKEVRLLHDDIYRRTLAGDLTPFKAFRRREFQETVSRMGHLPDNANLAQRLVEEICMTREVLDACQWLKARDCLMVALSDKPDEATAPTPDQAAQGYHPLHRTKTHVIGQETGIGR
jgi:hypothetical protein